ncbi:MAG: preprotein translocase subunit SecG [Gammaproteobacteria bacterium]|nr:preprotein translocase subunit SecG [Gammaproteobacteria bacterium]
MKEAILIVHVFAALGLVGLVLLQQGRGADMGAAFGSGASQTLFGASGSATFLSRITKIFALVFFCTSLLLTYWYTHMSTPKSVTELDALQQPAPAPQVPSTPPSLPPANPVPEVPK